MKTRYDLWVESEKDKIHKEFEEKRQELLDKSLLFGLNEKSKTDADCRALSEEYKALDQQEQAAINEFMKNIQGIIAPP